MTEPGWALQKAAYDALVADANVIAALGGARVYDHVPRNAAKPYVTFAQSVVRDWSAGSDEAHEHSLTLHVWANATGRKQVAIAIEVVRAVLHDVSLTMDGHHLVNLRHEFSEIRKMGDGERLQGLIRFRAVSEPTV